MTLKSLYTYLKAYFNYVTSGNRIYARAIAETMGVIREALDENKFIPIQKYCNNTFALRLTKEMLKRFVSIAKSQYKSPSKELEYFKVIANIDKEFITTHHKGINVPIEGGWDNKNRKLIIFTFSQAINMVEEVRVIKGLLKEFVIQEAPSVNIKTVAYWDLSNESVTEIDYEALQPVDKESLIEGANRIK